MHTHCRAGSPHNNTSFLCYAAILQMHSVVPSLIPSSCHWQLHSLTFVQKCTGLSLCVHPGTNVQIRICTAATPAHPDTHITCNRSCPQPVRCVYRHTPCQRDTGIQRYRGKSTNINSAVHLYIHAHHTCAVGHTATHIQSVSPSPFLYT